jgi:hypothetical protein
MGAENYAHALSSYNHCQPHQAPNEVSNDHDYLLFEKLSIRSFNQLL